MLLQELSQAGIGLMLLNEKHKVLRLNKAAQDIIADDDGISLYANHIELNHSVCNQQLQSIFNTHHHLPHHLCIPRISKRADYQLIIIRSKQPFVAFDEHHVAIMLIIDPSKQNIVTRTYIQQRFIFTERGTDVAISLLQGKTVRELAKQLSLTYESARRYTKQMCNKAGVSGQAKFIALFLKTQSS